MPLPVYRLRRWFAVLAVLFTAVVAGMYFYARMREHSVLARVPGKIGYDIKQTASGFQFSKSEGGRTLFSIQAAHVTQFKLNGEAQLHNVTIVLYGKDSSRFDQIYGDNFSYDQKTGDVVAAGQVQIDLEANPEGATSPDQAAPKELKNPIHLKTSNLTFNSQTGVATTDGRVDFRTVQAAGWAVGARYNGHTNELTLPSQVHVTFSGDHPSTLEAASAQVTNSPRLVVMQKPILHETSGTLWADEATLWLGTTNNVERVLAKGNVHAEGDELPKNHGATIEAKTNEAPAEVHASSDTAELDLVGEKSQLRTAILTGNVHVDRVGGDFMEGTAGRAVLNFSGDKQLDTIHAEQNAHLVQRAGADVNAKGASQQDFDIQAPAINFVMAGKRGLDHAVTSGPAQITIRPAQNVEAQSAKPIKNPDQQTVITAGKFEAHFAKQPDGKSHLASVHGAPDVKVVSTASGEPDRISTSQTIDATFLPRGGVDSVVQQGNVVYTDTDVPSKRTQAWAEQGRYTPADQILTLTGHPRVVSGSMETTAQTVRINRGNGDAFADSNVKTTYSDVKEDPRGALLSSSSPIHVTAASMTAHKSPAEATYTGNVRLWQDTNVVEAPSILFDRNRKLIVAKGTTSQPVSTTLVQASAHDSSKDQSDPKSAGTPKPIASDRESPITITGLQLTYNDAERKAHYEGGVVAKGAMFTESSRTLDAYLVPRSQISPRSGASAPSQLDHMVAEGSVVVVQPDRRATGDKLVYTTADDKFVLTGGPPSIFDAERGKITGVSLTFFRRDDRVLVEGKTSSPVVTQTRVAR